MDRFERIQKLDRFAAMEGLISRFKNRDVKPSSFTVENSDKYPKYRDVREVLNAAINGERNGYGRNAAMGIVEDLRYNVEIEDSDFDTAKASAIMKKVQRSIGKAQNVIASSIVAEYNDSQGKSGPWEWTERGAEFSPKKLSDVTSKIRLELVEFFVLKDGVSTVLYFDDGRLWWGHSVSVEGLFDLNGNMTESKMRYSLDG